MAAFAFGHTQHKPEASSQAEQELIALSRKAVDDCIGGDLFVLDGAAPKAPLGVPGKATARGKYYSVELADPQARIDGGLAVVTGRVLFKGGLSEWQTKDSSHSVTIRFARREGLWEFVGLCLGECAAE